MRVLSRKTATTGLTTLQDKLQVRWTDAWSLVIDSQLVLGVDEVREQGEFILFSTDLPPQFLTKKASNLA